MLEFLLITQSDILLISLNCRISFFVFLFEDFNGTNITLHYIFFFNEKKYDA